VINEYYATSFCCEDISKIENYRKAVRDKTQTWDCHHRREISESKSAQQLKNEDLYYNVPASDLIFLKHSEHARLHSVNMSKETHKKLSKAIKAAMTDKVRKKISDANKGRLFSQEHRKHLSESLKGKKKSKMSIETKRKISEGNKGKLVSNETRRKISKLRKGMKFSDEHCKNISKSRKYAAKKNEKVNYKWFLTLGLVPNKIYTWEELSNIILNDLNEPYYKDTSHFIIYNKTLFDIVDYRIYKFLDRKDLLK